MSQVYEEGIEQALFEITMIISNQSNLCHPLLKRIFEKINEGNGVFLTILTMLTMLTSYTPIGHSVHQV